jgi:hypothetical protein
MEANAFLWICQNACTAVSLLQNLTILTRVREMEKNPLLASSFKLFFCNNVNVNGDKIG